MDSKLVEEGQPPEAMAVPEHVPSDPTASKADLPPVASRGSSSSVEAAAANCDDGGAEPVTAPQTHLNRLADATGEQQSRPQKETSEAQAMLAATRAGDIEGAKAALAAGCTLATVLKPDSTGSNALHNSAAHGHTPLVRWLLEQGAEVDARRQLDGHTALDLATSRGHLECVRVLLVGGADASIKSISDALFKAKKRGHADVAALLHDPLTFLIETKSWPAIEQAHCESKDAQHKFALSLAIENKAPATVLAKLAVRSPPEALEQALWQERQLCAARQRLAFTLRGKSDVETVLPYDVLVALLTALPLPSHAIAVKTQTELRIGIGTAGTHNG
eukprot:COSAG02_NODE_9939_length_2070_cov_1.429731_3_plen_334_part_00